MWNRDFVSVRLARHRAFNGPRGYKRPKAISGLSSRVDAIATNLFFSSVLVKKSSPLGSESARRRPAETRHTHTHARTTRVHTIFARQKIRFSSKCVSNFFSPRASPVLYLLARGCNGAARPWGIRPRGDATRCLLKNSPHVSSVDCRGFARRRWMRINIHRLSLV